MLARGRVCLCKGSRACALVQRLCRPCAPALHQARGACAAGPAGRDRWEPWELVRSKRLGAPPCGSLFVPRVAAAGPACSRGSSASGLAALLRRSCAVREAGAEPARRPARSARSTSATSAPSACPSSARRAGRPRSTPARRSTLHPRALCSALHPCAPRPRAPATRGPGAGQPCSLGPLLCHARRASLPSGPAMTMHAARHMMSRALVT